MKKIYIIIALVFLTSCSPLIKLINGEKTPREENLYSLNAFIEENHLNISMDKSLFFKDQYVSRRIFARLKEYNYDTKLSVPDVYVFDENFNLIDDNLLGGCVINRPSSSEKDFYEEIYKVNKNLLTEHNLYELKDIFMNAKGENIFPFTKGRRTAIVLWAKYKGEKWAEEVKYIDNLLKKSSIDFDIYYLNLDPKVNFNNVEHLN